MIASRELPQFVKDLLASPPQRGEGLNLWLYKMARVLHPFRAGTEISQLLYADTAGQAIKRGEVERAIERSAATVWKPGQSAGHAPTPKWPKVNAEQREAIIASGLGLVDLWETSPVRFEDDSPHSEEIIDALFPGNPLLCAGQSSHQFDTRPREDWRGRLAEKQLIVPSPMTARTGRTQDGKESTHTLENTGARHFLIVEQDAGNADEQAAVLLHLATLAPLVLAVHSGSKSIHGWFTRAYCHDSGRRNALKPHDLYNRIKGWELVGKHADYMHRYEEMKRPRGRKAKLRSALKFERACELADRAWAMIRL